MSSRYNFAHDTPEEDKKRRHAEAQARYREKNLTATRREAKLRMERLRDNAFLSLDKTKELAQRRWVVDADYRERQRKQKFIKKYGRRAFVEHYLPLHDIFGPHLPGQKFNEADMEAKRTRKKKGKKTKTASGVPPEVAN